MGDFSATAKALMSRYLRGDKGVNIILEAKPIRLGTDATETLFASVSAADHSGAAKPCLPRLQLSQLRQRSYNPRWGSLRPGDIYNFALFNTPNIGFGGFTIANADNGADSWDTDYNWQSAECKLVIGERHGAYTAFEDLWHFIVRGDPDTQIHGVLAFRDVKLGIVDFNQPVQTATVAQTDRLAPLVYGSCQHVRPELLNASTSQYVIASARGLVDNNFIVYEGGSIVTSHGTKDAANGRFTFDDPPAYDLSVRAFSTHATPRRLVKEAFADLLTDFGVTSNLVGTGLSLTTGGVYVSQDHNFRIGQALSLMLGPKGIWWVDADGSQVSFTIVRPPEHESTGADFLAADISTMRRIAVIPPITQHRLLISKYWDPPATTIIQDASLIARFRAGGIWREIAAVHTDYPDAISVTTDTSFGGTYGSSTGDLPDLFDTPRSIYRITLTPLRPLDAWIGDYISVTTPKLPGFSTAKNLLVVGVELDFPRRRVVLDAFG